MGINLKKGNSADVGISNAIVGLGWVAQESSSGFEFDLDASAFMVGENHKIPDDLFFVFYNNQTSLDGSVQSSGDDRSGGGGDDDNESLTVQLDKVDPKIREIIFVVSIYECMARKQDFGQVDQAYIRIVDQDTGKEILRYQLEDDFGGMTLIEFGKLVRNGKSWKFEAMGNAYRKELDYLVDKYAG
jgi:tellurium resistance protein TerD